MGQLADIAIELAAAGDDFDRWLAALAEWEIYEAGRNTSLPLHPAHYWTHAGGRQAVDFVGRIEDFEADFARMCGLFGLDEVGTTNENVTVDPAFTGPLGYKYAHLMTDAAVARTETLFARGLSCSATSGSAPTDFSGSGYP